MAPTFGEVVASARAKHDPPLTQVDLAEKVGVHQQTVSKWELNRRKPRPEMIDDIAAALGVDPDVLFRAAFNRRPPPK